MKGYYSQQMFDFFQSQERGDDEKYQTPPASVYQTTAGESVVVNYVIFDQNQPKSKWSDLVFVDFVESYLRPYSKETDKHLRKQARE